MSQRKPAPAAGISPKELDSIRADVQQSVTDSVMRMLATTRRGEPRSPPLGVEFPSLVGIPGREPAARLLLPGVIDGSRDKSLGPLAEGLTDSLRRVLSRRRGIQLLDAGKLGISGKLLGDARLLAREAGADYVVQGVVRALGDDSVQVVMTLLDASDSRISKSLHHAGLRTDAAALPATVAPTVDAWLEHRLAGRSVQRFRFPTARSIDSIIRQSERLRDSLRKRPRPRRDSSPPTA
jgi:TolB-like protein